jgi:hypothetical protein
MSMQKDGRWKGFGYSYQQWWIIPCCSLTCI